MQHIVKHLDTSFMEDVLWCNMLSNISTLPSQRVSYNCSMSLKILTLPSWRVFYDATCHSQRLQYRNALIDTHESQQNPKVNSKDLVFTVMSVIIIVYPTKCYSDMEVSRRDDWVYHTFFCFCCCAFVFSFLLFSFSFLMYLIWST